MSVHALPDSKTHPETSETDNPANVSSFGSTRKHRRKRRVRKRKKRKMRGLPAWAVFWATLIIMGLCLYRGMNVGWVMPVERLMVKALLAVSALLGAAVLFIDEKWSFSWSKSMRRSYEVRTNLNKGEIFALCFMVVATVMVFMMRLVEYMMWYVGF